MNSQDLEGKVAIVTGGASGLGRATVERFVEEGAKVVIADTNAEGGAAFAAELGSAAAFQPTDVSDADQIQAAVDFAVEHFGGLHVMCNNAGIGDSFKSFLADDFAAHGFNFRRLIRSIALTEAFAIDSAIETETDSGPSSIAEAAWAVFPMTRLRPEQVAGALIQASSAETIDSSSSIFQRLGTYGGINEFVARHGDPGEDEFNLEGSSTIPQRLLMMNGDLVQKHIREDIGNASARIAALAPDDRKAVGAPALRAVQENQVVGGPDPARIVKVLFDFGFQEPGVGRESPVQGYQIAQAGLFQHFQRRRILPRPAERIYAGQVP